MRIKIFTLIFVATSLISKAYAFYGWTDSLQQASCIDPIICQLDSMSSSLFTRDKFYVDDASLQASINMPYDAIPKYTEDEMRQKLKLIPSLIPLNYTTSVKQFIDFFAYRRRGLMTSCLANSQIYFPIFESILDKKGLPLELKYLAIVESAFNPVAVSRAGATGLWQLMYSTGTQMGLNINSYVDERRDPVKATEAATNYLKMLYEMYGDWQLVLAAYNSGPGVVNKAIARAGGVKNFWAILNYLPAETRSYVPTYIALAYVMNYYQDYKLVSAEPRRDLYAIDTVLISSKVSLKHISEVLGIPLDELQFLNPSLRAGVIPYSQNGIGLNLPIRYFALFEARSAEIMNDSSQLAMSTEPILASKPKVIWYKVRKHDTMAKIAARYGVAESSIRKVNKLKNSYVYVGQTLKLVIPTYTVEAPAYAQAFALKPPPKHAIDSVKASAALADTQTALVKDTFVDTVSSAARLDTNIHKNQDIRADKSCNCVYLVVQPGDTLWSITQRYEGLTIDKLKADNRDLLDRPLKVGDVIKIVNQ